MLRLPAAGDTPPPLMAPLRTAEAAGEEQPAAEGEVRRKKRRRSKKKDDALDWEKQASGSRKGENRQMRQMLIGGSVLFVGIVLGVIYLMNSGGHQGVTRSESPAVETPAVEKPVAEDVTAAAQMPVNAELLAHLEALVRDFLEAKTIEAVLPLVRHPALTEARMRGFYAASPMTPEGLSVFNADNDPLVEGNRISVLVRTGDFEERRMQIFETENGRKVDWESWVGWSEISWPEMVDVKPTTGKIFRVTLSAVDYYNFGFGDDGKWQSYRLESADREHVVFGYVEKGSALDQSLRLDADTTSAAMTLSLKFPEGATSANQVVIEKLIAKGWVLEEE